LIVMDGVYSETIDPSISGVAGKPITIKALNKGNAIIQKEEDGPAISIYSNTNKTISHITIDGFIARSKGEYSAIRLNSSDNIAEELMTNNIIIRNTGTFGSANQTNTMSFGISRVRDSLMEDVWVVQTNQ